MFFKASSAPPHPPPRRRRSPELCGEAEARPRVGRRRRNDGDLWVERGKRRNREETERERYSTLCYSSSSSSFI